MARIAIFLPSDDIEFAAEIAKKKFNLNVVAAHPVDHDTNMQELLEQTLQGGADIIIARGSLATTLCQMVRIAVIEVRITKMDMLQAIQTAKARSGKECPKIGLVCSKNLACDLTGLNEIAGVELISFYPELQAEFPVMIAQAIVSGVDAFIGGDMVCAAAAQNGLPFALLKSGPEGIGEACRIAGRISCAIDEEKRNGAELKIVLDHATQGLIQIDRTGLIRRMNQSAQHMLDTSEQDAAGTSISRLIPTLNAQVIAAMMEEGKETVPHRHKVGDESFLISGVPVITENSATGAIISITEGRKLQFFTLEARRDLIRQGYIAAMTFDTIPSRSPQSRILLEQAKRYAKFDLPVLILGEFGTEKEELAQCIHNASDYADNAFVHFNCSTGNPERVTKQLFGPGGLVEKAQGILFLAEISQLTLEAQYLLYRLIAGRRNANYGGMDSFLPPLRIIAADSSDIKELVQQGVFREDLYYALSGMLLRIPPLRQREKDVLAWGEFILQNLQERHGRYIHLTRGAWKRMMEFDWPGNQAQLYSVCQKIIVESPRQTVDDAFLHSLLSADIFQAEGREGSSDVMSDKQVFAGQDSQAAQIDRLLRRYRGNRSAVAKEMGISTTTLWRYMKKFGFLK